MSELTTTSADHGRSILLLAMFMVAGISGCIDQSPLPVVFDQVLETTTFTNRLLSPVVLYRNGEFLDTLPRLTSRTYPIGEKGVYEHRWRLISPRNAFGAPYGIEAEVDLGVQYRINESIEIRNRVADGTIFTPRIFNSTFSILHLSWVNYREVDERFVGLPIYPNQSTSIDNAPYYYWNSSSNVVIEDPNGFRYWEISREDTNSFGEPLLELSDDPQFSGTGATDVILIF